MKIIVDQRENLGYLSAVPATARHSQQQTTTTMNNPIKLPKLRPHKLRRLSNVLHEVAMILPLPLARPLGKLSSRLYYSLAD